MDKRNIDLAVRKEDTKNKKQTLVIRFQLTDINEHFSESITAINEMCHIADGLIADGKIEQAENIWKSQIVFLVSALDYYMHEITKLGLGKIFEEEWEQTEKYKNINMTLGILNQALNNGEGSEWFIEFVNSQYAKVTMVSYDSVRDQLNLLGLDMQRVADDVFYDRNSREKTKDQLKRCLNELFSRRNIIAHQSGRRHEDAKPVELTKEEVSDYILKISKIVSSINLQIEEK